MPKRRARFTPSTLGPNRKQRKALAKAAVTRFKDELTLAGYSLKWAAKRLASWNGDPKVDPFKQVD